MPAIINPDVKRAVEKLTGKMQPYKKLWDYYDGDHELKFSSKRLREVFGGALGDTVFIENWMGVVVDALLERVQLTDLTVSDNDALSDDLQELFKDTELDLDADDVHRAAFVCGESFVIVWPEEDDAGNLYIGAYYNDPRRCHMFYDEENPKAQSLAAKWWRRVDGYWQLTLYYPDRFEYYITNGKVDEKNVPEFNKFIAIREFLVQGEGGARWPENPFGQIPVFHFQTDRRKPKSQIKQVLPIQDAINKLFSDMMVSAEFSAFPQRYFVTNADMTDIKSAPGKSMTIPAGDGDGEGTQVGQFAATDLGNYLNGIAELINAIAAITGTPRHFFIRSTAPPSGEALIALESPLNKKAEKFIGLFSSTWRRLGVFLMAVGELSTEMLAKDISPVFDRPETVQPRTQSEIREIDVRTGIPLSIALKREGWTAEEIAELEAEVEEQKRETQQAEQALVMSAFQQAAAVREQTAAAEGEPAVAEGEVA